MITLVVATSSVAFSPLVASRAAGAPLVGRSVPSATGTVTAVGTGDCGEITLTGSGFVPADFDGLDPAAGLLVFNGTGVPADSRIVAQVPDLAEVIATGSFAVTAPGPLVEGSPIQILGTTTDFESVVVADTTVAGGCDPVPATLELTGGTELWVFDQAPALPEDGLVYVYLSQPGSVDVVGECTFAVALVEGPQGPMADASGVLTGSCVGRDGVIEGLVPSGLNLYGSWYTTLWEVVDSSGPVCNPECALRVTSEVFVMPDSGPAVVEFGVVSVGFPSRSPLSVVDVVVTAGEVECRIDPTAEGIEPIEPGVDPVTGEPTATGLDFLGVGLEGGCSYPAESACADLDLASPVAEVRVYDENGGDPAVVELGLDLVAECEADPVSGELTIRFHPVPEPVETTTTTTAGGPTSSSPPIGPTPLPVPGRPLPLPPRFTG